MAFSAPSRLLELPKSAPLLLARHGRRVPELASLLLVMAIAWLAAKLVWALVPVPASAAWQPVAPPPKAARAVGLDLNTIVNAQLFGAYQAPADPVLADLAAAPDTNLNLTLLGILANGRNDKNSRALILAQGGDEKPYGVGDDVTRGVTLTAIFPDRVILSRSGKLETLRLDKDSPGAPLVLTPPGAASQTPPQENIETSDDAGASLSQIRTELLNDPSKIADYIRVQPVNSGGGVSGYRIYPGKDRTIFSAAGLRPGDVVTSVNGVALNDPAKSLQLLSDLSKSSQLSLIVDRGGTPQNFNINLGQ